MTQNSTSLTVSAVKDDIIAKFGDFNTILTNLHPVKVQSTIIERGVFSNKVALQTPSLTLAQFTGAYSRDNTYRVIELWLYDLSEYAGVKGKLTPQQISQAATLFYQEAYCLNFTELGLFFNRVKKGQYGDFYGQVDPIRILSFLKDFMSDRYDAIEKINRDNEVEARKQADLDWQKRKENMSQEDYDKIKTSINNFIKQIL